MVVSGSRKMYPGILQQSSHSSDFISGLQGSAAQSTETSRIQRRQWLTFLECDWARALGRAELGEQNLHKTQEQNFARMELQKHFFLGDPEG